MNKKVIGVIPSRYASTRFPGKPLVDIAGKTMIRRVYEQASKSTKLNKVLVATDDQRIYDEVQSFGGLVKMTAPTHINGTERCHEVLESLTDPVDYLINIQGDEPFIKPEMIDNLVSILDGQTELGTLVKKITDVQELSNTNTMKVVLNKHMEAMYFSRNCIPHVRGAEQETWLEKHVFYKHIGIYAYRSDILSKIASLLPAKLELAESLEQLRWLEEGLKIKVASTQFESQGIDTPDDLLKIKNLI